MSKAPELWLTQQYAHLMTAADYELHDELAVMSLSEMMDDVTDRLATGTFQLGDEGYLRLHEMRAADEATSKQAALLFLPYGNGFSPGMRVRSAVYQRFFPEGMRLLVVGNNTLGETAYDLPQEGNAAQQLARKTMHAVARLGIEKVHVIGESQGAMVGAFLLDVARDELEVASFSLKDAPNTVERTEKQLLKDFQGDGLDALRALNIAISHAGLPALVRAQRSGGGLDAVPQAIGMARFGLGSLRATNKRMHAAMTERSFVDALRSANAAEFGAHGQVVRYGESLVCTDEIYTDLGAAGLRDLLTEVRYYGHEGTDQVILNALLNRRAMTGRRP